MIPYADAPSTSRRFLKLTQRVKREFRKTTWRYRALPNFLIVGCQKGGTSSLHAYLAQHPSLAPAAIKEVHFFDGGLLPSWEKYADGERLYRSYFGWDALLKAQGRQSYEASPCYMFNPLAPSRMAAMVPDAKLIVLLRDPVDRAISHYFHEKRKGREPLAIMDALFAEDERLAVARCSGNYKDLSWINHSYVTRGLYAEQLERVFEYYPLDQVLILESSEFYGDPKRALAQVLAFIGLDDIGFDVDLIPVNVGTNRTEMAAEVHDHLTAQFAESNKRLFDLLSRRFDW